MQKYNKIVLFDIDHTLFNTELFRKTLYKDLANGLGLTDSEQLEVINNKYYETKNIFGYFKPEDFLKAILKISKSNINLKNLRAIFHENRSYHSFIFPDVKKTFLDLDKKNVQIGIFSTGETAYQKIKIESLKNYLKENHVHIAPNKFKAIKDTFDIYKTYQTYLVDDFPQILEGAKNHNKNIFTIFIKRKESLPSIVIPDNFKPDATITSLNQLASIIKANN